LPNIFRLGTAAAVLWRPLRASAPTADICGKRLWFDEAVEHTS